MIHATFATQSDAINVYNQMKAVATNASVARIGEAGERTSYALVATEAADGTLTPVNQLHIDMFGIVREDAPDPNTPPAWIQPTGAQDAYPLQDVFGNPVQVTYQGATWQNTTATNTYAPGTYGWTKQ